MITFNCHCTYPFSLPDDEAGGLVQCPKCGRLNDVPSLSDLKNLDGAGGFKVAELQLPDESQRLRDLARAFTRERFDENGDEIDLRPTLEEVQRAGSDEIPLADGDIGPAPKYDPLTGELVEPLQVKPDPAPHSGGPIPMATPVLGYATGPHRDPVRSVALALFRPENVVVMAMVFLLYVAMGLATFLVSPITALLGLRAFWVSVIVLVPLLAAHYVCVLVDVAIEEHDELPRPLRNVSWSEDVWMPFKSCFASLMICYFPLWIWMQFFGHVGQPTHDAVLAGLYLGGSALFPAVLLTFVASGSAPNLRPDRVIGVMVKGGLTYAWLAALWTVLLLLSLLCIGGMELLPTAALRAWMRAADLPAWVAVLVVFGHLYGLHYATWKLGLLYRTRHDRFPWVYQQHTYRNRTTRRPGGIPTSPRQRPAGSVRAASGPARPTGVRSVR